MISEARHDLNIDLANSYMVGDSPSDIAAGRKAGSLTVRIGDGQDYQADLRFASLLDFALFLKKESLRNNIVNRP